MEIQTFVFLDTETTGLRSPDIIELSMVAYRRRDLLEASSQNPLPRVMTKILLHMKPNKVIDAQAEAISGLRNDMLADLKPFDVDTGNLIKSFLNQLKKPLCLVAHNGLRFDFPILRRHLSEIGVSLGEDIYCMDTLDFFRRIDVGHRQHKLIEIYMRRFGNYPAISHHAENDVENLIKCVVDAKEDFFVYTNIEHGCLRKFSA